MKVRNGFLSVVLVIAVALVQAQTSANKTARKPPANDQETLQEIQELETSLREAFMDGKTVWWDRHLDDHYSGMNPDGRIASKTDALHLYGSPEIKYEEMVMSDVAARIFNGDCVVATGRTAVKGSYGGRDFSGEYYFVHVWIKNGTDFKLASAQATKMPG